MCFAPGGVVHARMQSSSVSCMHPMLCDTFFAVEMLPCKERYAVLVTVARGGLHRTLCLCLYKKHSLVLEKST